MRCELVCGLIRNASNLFRAAKRNLHGLPNARSSLLLLVLVLTPKKLQRRLSTRDLKSLINSVLARYQEQKGSVVFWGISFDVPPRNRLSTTPPHPVPAQL